MSFEMKTYVVLLGGLGVTEMHLFGVPWMYVAMPMYGTEAGSMQEFKPTALLSVRASAHRSGKGR